MAKGEVFKFSFRPLIIDDKVVKDGLEAVGTLNNKEPYYVVGGIGVQSYIPTSCRRPTSDIDLSIVKPLNYADFRNTIKSVEEYLMDNHYAVNERKGSRAFKLEIENRKNPEERLIIEFSRRNKKNFEKSKKKLERELDNAKNKILEERSSSYVVASPEDLAIPKFVRTVNSITRNEDFRRHIPKGREPLYGERIKTRLNFISEIRGEATLAPADVELAEQLRLFSDIYDIRILSEIAGFNSQYFLTACKDWDTVSNKTPQRDLLLEAILPEFLTYLEK